MANSIIVWNGIIAEIDLLRPFFIKGGQIRKATDEELIRYNQRP